MGERFSCAGTINIFHQVLSKQGSGEKPNNPNKGVRIVLTGNNMRLVKL